MSIERRVAASLVVALLLALPASAAATQRGTPHEGASAVQRTTSELRAAVPRALARIGAGSSRTALTSGFGFAGPSLADSPSALDPTAFVPDTTAAAGPSQFIAVVNDRLRSYAKASGAPDNVLNIAPNTFFAPVMTPIGGGVATNRTSRPRIRYDRLSQRWIIVMIDVPNDGAAENRVMIARSDGPVISPATVWYFFFFVEDVGGPDNLFADYPTLGVDANALYIGANMLTLAGTFAKTNMYVVRKSSILASGPLVVTRFDGAATGAAGVPQGVDNPDPGATAGYFIGIDTVQPGRLALRTVSNPGATPTISSEQVATVPATAAPIAVDHLGNAGGSVGQLDAVDARLVSAQMRSGHIWAAHNIGVDGTGTASVAASRNASRWYEVDVAGAPSLVQSGTLFDPAAVNPKSYWIPALAVNGQNAMAIAGSVAGAAHRVDAWFSGRLPGDLPGQLDAPTEYTASSFNYNPPGDTGAGFGHRRWGEYSATTVDPDDDMTFWTIQEYVSATNTWGTRVARLAARPPATPFATTPARVLRGQPSINVTLTGNSTFGSAFFDPGAGFANRLGIAVGCAITVNGVTFVNGQTLQLNLNTTAATAGPCDVTVTNPDGQTATGSGVLRPNLPPGAADDAFTIDQGSSLSAPTVLANDADPDGDPMSAVGDSAPAHGTLALQAAGAFTYTPAKDFSGTDSFTYHASDGLASSPSVTVRITVRPLAAPSLPPAPGPPPAPSPPSASGFSKTLTVSRTGSFTFRFKATAGRSAKITFTSRAKVKIGSKRRNLVIGPKSFTVPSSGRVAFKAKLSRTQLRILRSRKRMTFDVRIVIGARTFKSTLVLKAPRRR